MSAGDDDPEWKLLHELSIGTADALAALESFYQQRGAWDEFSVVRTRQLAAYNAPSASPGPVPGGPFPRIGAPRQGERPTTILSRWLNRDALPELYATPEVPPRELELQLREALIYNPKSIATRIRIGDVLCAQLEFAEAAGFYASAVSSSNDPAMQRVRARLEDARHVLLGRR